MLVRNNRKASLSVCAMKCPSLHEPKLRAVRHETCHLTRDHLAGLTSTGNLESEIGNEKEPSDDKSPIHEHRH